MPVEGTEVAEATGETKTTEGAAGTGTTTTGQKPQRPHRETTTTGTTGTTAAAETGGTTGKTDADKVNTGAGTYTAPDATYPAQYSRYYDYNQTGINDNEKAWSKFVADVIQLIEKNGKAQIVIESSASNVPTKTYGTNDKLSTERRNDAGML